MIEEILGLILCYSYFSFFIGLILATILDLETRHPLAVCSITWPIILFLFVVKNIFVFLNWVIDVLIDCGKLTIKMFVDIVR